MATAGVSPDTGHRDAIMDTHSHVIDELDAPTLATLDAIMQARSGAPPERPG